MVLMVLRTMSILWSKQMKEVMRQMVERRPAKTTGQTKKPFRNQDIEGKKLCHSVHTGELARSYPRRTL